MALSISLDVAGDLAIAASAVVVLAAAGGFCVWIVTKLLKVGGWLGDIKDLGMTISENSRATRANSEKTEKNTDRLEGVTDKLEEVRHTILDHEHRIRTLERR